MGTPIRAILASQDAAAISGIIVRSFDLKQKNRRTRKLSLRQLERAVLLVGALGTVPQMLEAWSVIPWQRPFLPTRLLLFRSALRYTDLIRKSAWVHQKLSQSLLTEEEIRLLHIAFGGDEVAVNKFLTAVAHSRPPMPLTPLLHVKNAPVPTVPL